MESQAYSIIAATLYGNRGAEAMLETVVGRLRDESPSTRFHVFSYYPTEDRAFIRDDRLLIHSSTPSALVAWLLPWSLVFGVLIRLLGRKVLRMAPTPIRALAESVALVDLAGVAFIDGREKFLPFNILTLLPAWLLGVPIIKMPQAVGPFKRPLNRVAARLVLPMCLKIWARGGRTLVHLKDSGFQGIHFEQADDIAFNHQNRYSLTNEHSSEAETRLAGIPEARADGAFRGVVGLCPSSVLAVKSRKEGGNYEDVLVLLGRSLIDSGFLLVLFPNATRGSEGDAERNNDIPVLRRVMERLAQDGSKTGGIICFDMDLNAAFIKRIIEATDLSIVSRFHAMVGALSLSVPPLVLGWSHKYAEVMARFALERFVVDYKNLGAVKLLEHVEAVFDEREWIRQSIQEKLPEVKRGAARPVEDLLQLLDPRERNIA